MTFKHKTSKQLQLTYYVHILYRSSVFTEKKKSLLSMYDVALLWKFYRQLQHEHKESANFSTLQSMLISTNSIKVPNNYAFITETKSYSPNKILWE